MYLNCRGDKDAQARFEMLMGKTTRNDNDNEGSTKDNEGSTKDNNKHKKKKKKKHKHKEQSAK